MYCKKQWASWISFNDATNLQEAGAITDHPNVTFTGYRVERQDSLEQQPIKSVWVHSQKSPELALHLITLRNKLLQRTYGCEMYPKENASSILRGTLGPNKAASCAIFNRILRTTSPRYIPDIIFSKPCQPSALYFSLQCWQPKVETALQWRYRCHSTCSPGFIVSLSRASSVCVRGKWDDQKLPHSIFITCHSIIQ